MWGQAWQARNFGGVVGGRRGMVAVWGGKGCSSIVEGRPMGLGVVGRGKPPPAKSKLSPGVAY